MGKCLFHSWSFLLYEYNFISIKLLVLLTSINYLYSGKRSYPTYRFAWDEEHTSSWFFLWEIICLHEAYAFDCSPSSDMLLGGVPTIVNWHCNWVSVSASVSPIDHIFNAYFISNESDCFCLSYSLFF